MVTIGWGNSAGDYLVTTSTPHGQQANQNNTTLTVASNRDYTVTGNGDTINAGNSDNLTVQGNNNTTTLGSNSIMSISGTQNVVNTQPGNRIDVDTNSQVRVNGTGNKVTAANNSYTVVNGSGNTVTAGTGGVWFTGAGNNIVTAADGDTVGITSNGQWAVGDTVNMNNGTITVNNNSNAHINGNGNHITAYSYDCLIVAGSTNTIQIGTGNGFWFTSGGNNILTAADGDTIGITGNGQWAAGDTVNMNNGTITLNNNSGAKVNGNGNHITTYNGDSLIVGGSSNVITLGASSSFWFTSGGGNSINAANGDSIGVTGAGQTATADMVTLNNGTISVNSNSNATIVGSGNVVTAYSNDTVTINGSNTVKSATGNTNFTETGTSGNDTYQFARNAGTETITKNATSGLGKNGELDLATGIANNQLWFEQKGNDLQVDILGTTDHVTVKGWYSSDNAKFQAIKTADGNILDINAQFNLLVQNLATFAASHSAFNPTTATSFPNDPNLQSTLTASWHH